VSDIEAARAELVDRGADLSEVFHRVPGEGRVSGLDPARRSYASYASFSDPDGNGWLIQEVTMRVPGRVEADNTTFTLSTELAAALRCAGRAWRAREADRPARCELAGLVRRVHRQGAGWQAAAVMTAGRPMAASALGIDAARDQL